MAVAHNLADDIGGQGKDQTGLGRSNPIDRLAVIGREDQAGLDRGGIKDGLGQIETHQATLRKGLATGLGRPSLFQRKDRLTIQIGLEAGFGRYRQAHRPRGRQDVIFAVKEADRAGDIVSHMATFCIANNPRPDANIGLGSRKDLGRL